MVERRLHQRFTVQEGVYAFLSHDSQKLGEVIDVCQGGVAFSYKDISDINWITAHDDPVTQWSGLHFEKGGAATAYYELAFVFEDIEAVKQLPPLFKARLVAEFPVKGSRHFTKTMRCSLEFIHPTGYQEEWLQYFIDHHTLHSS
ncbi:MAG: hypothetical protein SWH61_15095 [Thermodesulfobacteriota bacterium]|nr:hypothetical protein [Thermodesulfobacteriota bacterium]